MPRVHVKKAAKDYPELGIAKGQTYYSWKRRYGPLQRSATPPKPSQLSGAKYAPILDMEGDLADVDADSLADAMRSSAEEVRAIGEEYQSSFDNMPEGLQQGDKGQELEERVEQCESIASALEDAADTLEEQLGELDERQGDATPTAKAKDEDGTELAITWAELRDDAAEEARSAIDWSIG
jgi:uncharacterized protein YukE